MLIKLVSMCSGRLIDEVLRYCFKFRLLLAALGLALSFTLFMAPPYNKAGLVRADLIVWGTTLLTGAALLSDIWGFYRSYGHGSTLTLSIIAFIFLIVARVNSLVYSMVVTDFTTPLIGGCVVDARAYLMAIHVFTGSVLGVAAIAIHTIFGGPLVLVKTPPYAEGFSTVKSWLITIINKAINHPLITAFAIGFIIRLIPELRWWPWPLGWDLPEYIAHLEDFLQNPNPFAPHFWMSGYRNIPPLLDMVLAPFAAVMGAWTVFKIYPVVAYGLLIAGTTYLSKKLLHFSNRYAVLTAIIASLFIMDLRLSYGYMRQLLGTALLVFAITFLELRKEREDLLGHALPSALLVLTAMSHEVTAAMAALLTLVLLLDLLRHKRERKLIALYVIVLVAIVALLLWYSKGPVWGNIYLGTVPPGLVSYRNVGTTVNEVFMYLVVGYGILIPPALLGLSTKKVFKLRYYIIATAVFLLAGISPLIAPYTSITSWWRFLISASPLLIPMVMLGLKSCRRELLAIYTILAVFPGLFFGILNTEGYYIGRLTSSLREFPPALTPLPSDTKALNQLLMLSKDVRNLNREIPIVAEKSVARWVHLGIRNPAPNQIIRIRGRVNLITACEFMAKLNRTNIYIVSTKELNKLMDELLKTLNTTKGIECGPYYITKQNFTNIDMEVFSIRNDTYRIYLITIKTP